MKRLDLEHWIAHHPDSIHADSKALLDRCENDAKDHAHRDAWIHAKEVAQKSLRRFEHGFGHPASDTFVTREVCHDLARELKHHEPKPDAHGRGNAEWLSRLLLDALDSEARGMFVEASQLALAFLDRIQRRPPALRHHEDDQGLGGRHRRGDGVEERRAVAADDEHVVGVLGERRHRAVGHHHRRPPVVPGESTARTVSSA